MTMEKYAIYKGLQKPLSYKGFKGKFIGWGIGSLIIGLLGGGTMGAMTNMYFGGFLTLSLVALGLTFTFHSQKKGLHTKIRNRGIFIHPVNLKNTYAGRL